MNQEKESSQAPSSESSPDDFSAKLAELERQEEELALRRAELQKQGTGLAAQSIGHEAQAKKVQTTVFGGTAPQTKKKYDTKILERITLEDPTDEQKEQYLYYDTRRTELVAQRSFLYTELMKLRPELLKLEQEKKKRSRTALGKVIKAASSLFADDQSGNYEAISSREKALLKELRSIVTEVMACSRWLDKYERWRP